jgi:alpha 1,2-mannosyltransferase
MNADVLSKNLVLARNGDLNGVVSSMKQLEDRFNKQFHYPYVFLNELPFEDNFKKYVLFTYKRPFPLLNTSETYRRVTELTDSNVQFGLIPNEHWVQPPHIDEAKATEARNQMVKDNVIYGGLLLFYPGPRCAISKIWLFEYR